MSTTASCGDDGITIFMLRTLLDTSFIELLFQLYYACLRKDQTPRRWNEACIIPLHKDKKKPYTAKHSRPISLLCLFRKISESLILSTLRSSGNMSYSPTQAGFRSGYSTLTNILTLHHQIDSDAGSHIVFLDFASAFDRVQWLYLKKELQRQGMYPLVIQLVHQHMYREMSFWVIVNSSPSRKLSHTSGWPLGSLLSPILFNRFIHSLLKTLNWQNLPTFPSSLWFTDDGVLVAPTFQKAQSLVNQVSKWADQHGMTFNVPKCGYLYCILPPRFRLQYALPCASTNSQFHMLNHTSILV